jgi:hypothetical protein
MGRLVLSFPSVCVLYVCVIRMYMQIEVSELTLLTQTVFRTRLLVLFRFCGFVN